MTDFALKTALSYLLGSVLGSLLLGRLTDRADIRGLGSGNPGSTNALRSHGLLFASGVAVVDVGKGWLATRVVPGLALPFVPPAGGMREWLAPVCGAAVIVGHVFPVWFGFRGGKGVAAFFGAVLGLIPRLALAVLLCWAGVLAVSGFVGLASIAAAVTLPALIATDGLAWDRPLLTFSLFAAVLIALTHRANIGRMVAGCEPRARGLWRLRRRAAS